LPLSRLHSDKNSPMWSDYYSFSHYSHRWLNTTLFEMLTIAKCSAIQN
jgi:hypothetical protein